MTPKEIVEGVKHIISRLDVWPRGQQAALDRLCDNLAVEISEAVKEERQACAQVVKKYHDDHAAQGDNDGFWEQRHAENIDEIVELILARSTEG